MTEPNTLDGATETPAPNVVAGTPGTFAARWNERSDAERQAYLDAVYEARQQAGQCWAQQHERIDEFRDALVRVIRLCDERAAMGALSPTGFYGDQMPSRLTVAEVRAAIEGRS